jgi:hypothetical protein
MTKCSNEGCKIRGSYALSGTKQVFCKEHRTSLMHDIKHKSCELCTKRPNFGFPGEKARFCKAHQLDGMEDVNNHKCKEPECKVITPCFGFKGDKCGSYCSKHHKDGMIDIRHARCQHPTCTTLATYCVKGSKKNTHCVTHKTDDMITPDKKLCKHPGCSTSPSYGKPSGKTEYCIKHADLSTMILLVSRLCAFEGCKVSASYNFKGEKPKFCGKHADDGMIIIYGSYCNSSDCSSLATFGVPGTTKPTHCIIHKKDGMKDVKHPLCDCGIRAYYGKPGTNCSVCYIHRSPGMIRRSNSKCKKCSAAAVYGKNHQNLHCEKHKLEGEENYVEQNCIGCGLTMVLDTTGKCEYCNPETYATRRLEKQKALMEYLDKHKLPGNSTDKIVEGGVCGKERPDRIFDCGEFVIILECDENQHKERSCECEQTRMVNIAQSFGGTPVYFIRFNPDYYNPYDDDVDCEKLQKRYSTLAKLLNDMIKKKITLPKALASAIYLYHDGWESLQKQEWIKLLEFV